MLAQLTLADFANLQTIQPSVSTQLKLRYKHILKNEKQESGNLKKGQEKKKTSVSGAASFVYIY